MAKPHRKFSIPLFLLSVALQLTALLVAFWYFFPDMWATQINAGPGATFLVFNCAHLYICFFEWGFHRYVLHAILVPWLAYFARSHRHHHGLTLIRLQMVAGSVERFILNRYPIVSADQYEDSAFPPYALAVFWLLFTPPLLVIQLLMPQAPIMLGGYLAIAWSMTGYEVFHAVEHFPYEWWKSATEHPRFGFIWRKVYGFHHFHHANVKSNEAISGFYGLPVADWVFGTYHQPKELLLEGRVATAKDFHVKPPIPFVRWLDNIAREQEAKIIRKAA